MDLSAIGRIKREPLCLAWAGFGLYVFLSSFFWASGPAPLRTVFYLFLLLPFLLALPWRKFRMEEYGGYYTLAALAYAAYSVFATLWGKPADFGFYFKQWFFLAFWLSGVAWLFYHRSINVPRLYLTVVVIGLVCALTTIYIFYVNKDYPLAMRLAGFGLAENSTIVAQIFGVAALLAYIASLQTTSWKLSPLFFFAAMVCALPIVMSQTRGAALALIVVAIAALIIVRPRPQIWLPQVSLAIVGLGLFFVLTNMEQVLEGRGLSLSYRDLIWRELLYRVPEHLFFGLGVEYDQRIIIPDVDVFHHAHNSWLDILYYTGLVGLALSLWHLQRLMNCFSRDKDIFPVYLWLVYGCLCLFTNGSSLLTRPDAQWWMYWVPAGLLAALVMSPRYAR